MVVLHVPILAGCRFALKDLTPTSYFVERYYRPLNSNRKVAMDPYSHLVNVPCHPGMESVSDMDLRRFFLVLSGVAASL